MNRLRDLAVGLVAALIAGLAFLANRRAKRVRELEGEIARKRFELEDSIDNAELALLKDESRSAKEKYENALADYRATTPKP